MKTYTIEDITVNDWFKTFYSVLINALKEEKIDFKLGFAKQNNKLITDSFYFIPLRESLGVLKFSLVQPQDQREKYLSIASGEFLQYETGTLSQNEMTINLNLDKEQHPYVQLINVSGAAFFTEKNNTINYTNNLYKGFLSLFVSAKKEWALWVNGYSQKKQEIPDIILAKISNYTTYKTMNSREELALITFINEKMILNTSFFTSEAIPLTKMYFNDFIFNDEALAPIVVNNWVVNNIYRFSNQNQAPSGTLIVDKAQQYRVLIGYNEDYESLLWKI